MAKENEPVVEYPVAQWIKDEIKLQQIPMKEVARRMGMSYSGLYVLLSSNGLPLHRLIQFSELLKYNFVALLGQKMNIPEPALSEGFSEKETIRKLEEKVATLQETIALAMRKA